MTVNPFDRRLTKNISIFHFEIAKNINIVISNEVKSVSEESKLPVN
jgi:hypothetical protein